jgi:glycosyltransferase involved in cell wall biosynthesis
MPALAAELGIGARVHFPGGLHGAELAAAYRGADAYAMTSRQEGLGIVVLEAQASGAPPIIMRCGGSDELVDEGKTGWLVDQGDEAELARKLRDLLASPEALRRAGAAARASVERTASVETFDRRVAHAYEAVFGAGVVRAGSEARSRAVIEGERP